MFGAGVAADFKVEETYTGRPRVILSLLPAPAARLDGDGVLVEIVLVGGSLRAGA